MLDRNIAIGCGEASAAAKTDENRASRGQVFNGMRTVRKSIHCRLVAIPRTEKEIALAVFGSDDDDLLALQVLSVHIGQALRDRQGPRKLDCELHFDAIHEYGGIGVKAASVVVKLDVAAGN